MVDVRIILSALWAARMLSGLQGDVIRFLAPGMLEEMIAGTTDVPVTNELLLVMSFIFIVAILMSILSLTLKVKASRWANRSIGIIFAAFDLIFLAFMIFQLQAPAYEIAWGFAYLVFTALVVWYAWKWPNPERFAS
jgi:Ca2+/Na+ antiporter